jgi:hypothetical protein
MQTKSQLPSHRGAPENKPESLRNPTLSDRPVKVRSVTGAKKPKAPPTKPLAQGSNTDREPQSPPTTAATAMDGQGDPREPITSVEAKIDVGFGNALFIRGEGQGLSWDKGLPLEPVDAMTWKWSTREAKDRVCFKLLVNDQVWAKGDDVRVEAGKSIQLTPGF